MVQRDRGKEYFTISVVSRMFNLHPQTLRIYEREGLLRPHRSPGNTRLYSREDVDQVEMIINLTKNLGVNLAGVEIILRMRTDMREMRRRMEQLIRLLPEDVRTGLADFIEIQESGDDDLERTEQL